MKAWPLLCVALLSACASLPPPVPDPARREAYLRAHPDWRLQGRVAYSYQGKGGSARVDWRQFGEHAYILLSAPLAAGSVRVRLEAGSAQIIDAGGKVLFEGAPEQVFAQALGATLPASDLPAGLRAFWPQAPEMTTAALAGALDLHGWQWRYPAWHDQPARLPKEIEVSRGEARLRILIDAWEALPDG